MSVKMMGHGIGLGSKASGDGVLYFDMSRYAANTYDYGTPPADTKPDDTNQTLGYVPWGADNKLPQKMVEDMHCCGVLEGAVDGKSRFGLGQGIVPMLLKGMNPDKTEILEPVNDEEISNWMEENCLFEQCLGWLRDMTGLGQDLARFKFDAWGNKIGFCTRHDVSEMRYTVKGKDGLLSEIQLSANWATGAGTPTDIIRLPLLPKIGTLSYLQKIPPEKRKKKEYAMVCRRLTNDRHYYSPPGWFSAKAWVAIVKVVPEMKMAIFNNSIRIKYEVIIHEEYWTRTYDDWEEKEELQETRRKELYDEIDSFLTGAKNTYKSIFVDGHTDPHLKTRFPDIEFKLIEDNTKVGELLPDSAAGNAEIMFPFLMNPALMGADSPGGPYSGGAGSGSNIREAAWVQVMIQEYERYCIIRKMNIVSTINGWKEKYPELVWRFPALMLTTLDTGKSTKDVTTGSGK